MFTTKILRYFHVPMFSTLIFTSASSLAASAPLLGTAAGFGVLAGSTVTNAGSTTVVGSDVGVSPGSAITGFPMGVVVDGELQAGGPAATEAQGDLAIAYADAASQPCDVSLTGQDLGGQTLLPGVYCFASAAQLTGAVTLDSLGDPNAVFIFQVGSALTAASGSAVEVINGGSNCNVFWQIGSSATLGTDSAFAGNVMAYASIGLSGGASISGRALAKNGAVTMDTNQVSQDACARRSLN